jgi:hypothetical protein
MSAPDKTPLLQLRLMETDEQLDPQTTLEDEKNTLDEP